MLKARHIAPLMALGVLGACDADPAGPAGSARVSVAFETGNTGSSRSQASASLLQDELRITGSNGTLVISDIRFIVAEFELERAESGDACDNSGSGNLCRDFEAPPRFVDLPLEGGSLVAAEATIEAGLYDELEFEIENLDDDEEDAEERQQLQQLFTQIRSQFPDWPAEASMLVVGSFTPTGGTARAFRVYVDAEIEVELEMDPPLDIGANTDPKSIAVTLDPRLWFSQPSGRVLDLSLFDYSSTGRLLSLEFEFEAALRGGMRARVDDD